MKRMLFLGVLISLLISGNAVAMGPAIGVIMKGAGIMGGQRNNDKAESKTKHTHIEKDNKGATKSGQNEMDSQKTTDDKSDYDGLIGCHSGTTQDDVPADKKADAVRDKQEHTH